MGQSRQNACLVVDPADPLDGLDGLDALRSSKELQIATRTTGSDTLPLLEIDVQQ